MYLNGYHRFGRLNRFAFGWILLKLKKYVVPETVDFCFCYELSMVPEGFSVPNNNRVFSKCTRIAIMPILASEALFRENKIIQLQNATLVSIEPLDL